MTARPLGIVGFDPTTFTRDVTLPVAQIAASRRVHDRGDGDGVEAFFTSVSTGRVADDDLSAWLHETRDGDARATVLRAVGL